MQHNKFTITCPCNHCSTLIAFDRAGAGLIAPCPHCGTDTLLFIPETTLPSPPPPSSLDELAAGEEIFYAGDDALVTKTRFIAHAQTFAIKSITEASMATTPPDKKRSSALICVGILGMLTGFASLSGNAIASLIFSVLGAAMLYLGIHVRRMLKDTYFVAISTAGQQIKTLPHKDPDKVVEIIKALNLAIIARGPHEVVRVPDP